MPNVLSQTVLGITEKQHPVCRGGALQRGEQDGCQPEDLSSLPCFPLTAYCFFLLLLTAPSPLCYLAQLR